MVWREGRGTAVRIIHGSGARCKEQKQKYLREQKSANTWLRRELLRRCSGEKEGGKKGGRRGAVH